MDDEFVINREAWHESWLRGYERICLQYLRKNHGDGEVRALIVFFNTNLSFVEERAVYEVKGQISVPRGIGMLCAEMAPYTVAHGIIVKPDRIKMSKGLNNKLFMKGFPEETFFMDGLLGACYPYKSDGRGFKMNAELMVGYEGIDELQGEMGEKAATLAAFFGCGYIFMKRIREFLDPFATPEQVMGMSSEKYLCVLERIKA